MTQHGIFTVTSLHHTPGDHAPKCLSGGQREMIGVEDKTKGEKKKWLLYL